MNNNLVILINSLRGVGGAEGVCITIANGLFEKYRNLTLLTLDLRGAKNIKKLNPEIKSEILNKKRALPAFIALLYWFSVHKPERVLVFNYKLAVMLVIIRFILRMRFRIISRNINILSIKKKEEKSFLHKYIIHSIVSALYKHVDLVIAQSQGMKEDLLTHYGISEKKINVINNPIQFRIETFLLNNESLPKNIDNYILCAGRLEPQKAFNYAVEAFAQVANDYPGLRLKFFGDGILKTGLKKQAFDLNLANRVDFEGYCQDIIPHYVHARLTVLTSLYEGLPNVLIESIALGTPVVSFDCPSGPSEIIQDGVNGYLARYLDVDHLTECIRLALDRQWDTEAVRASANRFSSSKIIDEYARVLS